MHATHEILRKSIHIVFGFFALALRWLPWEVAATIAGAAVVGNWLLLSRIVGARVARHERGWDGGILLYPLAVLVLILLFRERLEIAGTVWAILAFGDGFATLAGKSIGGPKLPWNRDKSWSGLAAFVAFGFAGAHFTYGVLQSRPTILPAIAIVAVAVLVCAIVESLATNLDDNLTVPIMGAIVMAWLSAAEGWPQPEVDRAALIWLAVNALLAIAGYAIRSVDLSGLIGGWTLGAILILFAGWELYVVLLTFFIIGTATTKFGYRRKAARGLAQEMGGRRGFGHAFSNAGLSAMLALMSASLGGEKMLWIAAAAALATAAADTTASEIGQLVGRTTFLPLSFRRVPAGTEGAISLEGSAAGALAGVMVAVVASVVSLARVDARLVALIAASAVIGSYLESLAGNWNRTRVSPVPNGVLNFFNTAVGAATALLLMRAS